MWHPKGHDRSAVGSTIGASKLIRMLLVLILALVSVVRGAWAQQPPEPAQQPQQSQEGTTPKPAGHGMPGLNDDQNADQNNERWQPDISPVTGLEAPTLGTVEARHSYWVPGLEYGSMLQSAPSTGWYANHYVGGVVSLLEASRRNELALNYSGGGVFSSGSNQGDSWYQLTSITDTLTLNHLQIQLFDNFSYIPQSSFGFMGGSSLAVPGVGGNLAAQAPVLSPGVEPNQSIYSAIGPRFSNASAAQTTFFLSRRGSITVGGSYGLLHFTQAGNVDSNMAMAIVGYNYTLTRTDSIGIVYDFASLHYSGQPEAFGAHSASLAYSKNVTQRLALDLRGGPQIIDFRVPVGNQSRTINASAAAIITYAREHGSINASYFYGLTNGGGVLVGALTSGVALNASRQVTRVWRGSIDTGYARNNSLGSRTATALPRYDDWFVGGGVSRPLGRSVNFSLNYTALFEWRSNQAACPSACNTSFVQNNTITMGVQWHTRPLVLQ